MASAGGWRADTVELRSVPLVVRLLGPLPPEDPEARRSWGGEGPRVEVALRGRRQILRIQRLGPGSTTYLPLPEGVVSPEPR